MKPMAEVKAETKKPLPGGKQPSAVLDPKGKRKAGAATSSSVAGKRSVRTSAKPGMSSSGVSVGGAGASGLSIPK